MVADQGRQSLYRRYEVLHQSMDDKAWQSTSKVDKHTKGKSQNMQDDRHENEARDTSRGTHWVRKELGHGSCGNCPQKPMPSLGAATVFQSPFTLARLPFVLPPFLCSCSCKTCMHSSRLSLPVYARLYLPPHSPCPSMPPIAPSMPCPLLLPRLFIFALHFFFIFFTYTPSFPSHAGHLGHLFLPPRLDILATSSSSISTSVPRSHCLTLPPCALCIPSLLLDSQASRGFSSTRIPRTRAHACSSHTDRVADLAQQDAVLVSFLLLLFIISSLDIIYITYCMCRLMLWASGRGPRSYSVSKLAITLLFTYTAEPTINRTGGGENEPREEGRI